ncbi:MAG: CaiB/BaiF CoA transferase family protein [Candidatus Dormibacteria bacterium]
MKQPSTTGPGALRGSRVLDLSRVLAGPLCCQMLGDHGAEVIKVESPAGDETRNWGPPFLEDGTSAYFTGLNRNKRNICLDARADGGRDVLEKLIAGCDVLVENFKAGTLAAWGLGYEEVLRERFPALVYCRITGFGVDGPMGGLPGYDAVLQAYGGLMSINGEPDGDPLRVGVPIVDLVAANIAFSGILLALFERSVSGYGQLVDISLLDAVVSILHPHSAAWFANGTTPKRTGSAHPIVAPYQTFETPAGPFFIGAGNNRQFQSLCAVLGVPALAADPRFANNSGRIANLPALVGELAPLVAGFDAYDLASRLLAESVPACVVNDVGEALSSPQVRHRDMVHMMDGYTGVGIPIKLGLTPGSISRVPAAKGAHTIEVLQELGYEDQAIATLHAAGTVHIPGADPRNATAGTASATRRS